MANKRKLNEIDVLDCNNSVSKKSKINKNHDILHSAMFTHPNDIRQYSTIFQTIQDSTWISNNNVEISLIKIITEYSTGQLVDCYLCSEKISFLEIECEQKSIKECLNCHSKNWYGECNVHQQQCGGPCCEDCSKCICLKLAKKCDQCAGEFCLECFPESLGEKCWDCALPNGDYI